MNPYAPTDSRYDLWPLYDVTPSDRPQRYAAYKDAQRGRGYVFKRLHHLAWCRERLAFWKARDPGSDIVANCRDSFLAAHRECRYLPGPQLPGFEDHSVSVAGWMIKSA